MPDHAARHSLLQELDLRQDDVLRQLEELNARVESLLKSCLSDREPRSSADSGE